MPKRSKRALWTAIRKLKERVVLHKELVERRERSQAPARNSGADLADDAEVKRLTTSALQSSCGVDAYEAAAADLMVARRSSIRSRSTSQYLSAESRSLSGGSHPTDSLRAIVSRP
jgi:hypothetical protein